MWTISKPSERSIQRFLAQQSDLDLTCPRTSVDPDVPPTGYQLDHNRVLLGEGDEVYSRACSLLENWEMFPRKWIEATPHDAVQDEGVVIASLAWAYGFWWTNPCRIVEVYRRDYEHLREKNRSFEKLAGPGGDAYGFTYATLPGHVESGAERFLILHDSDGRVWYDIRAYSRPRFWLTKAAKPIVRRLQKRFVRDSLQRMVEMARGPAADVSVDKGTLDKPAVTTTERRHRNSLQGIE